MTPKYHYAWHMADHLADIGFLPSCWCLERKHKHPKRFGTLTTNVSGEWHEGILRDVTARHLGIMGDLEADAFTSAPGLVNARLAGVRLQGVLNSEFGTGALQYHVATTARINEYESVQVEDVVWVGDAAANPTIGEVCMLARVPEGGCFAVLRSWIITRSEKHAWKCNIGKEYCVCEVSAVEGALIHGGDRLRTVLRPLRV